MNGKCNHIVGYAYYWGNIQTVRLEEVLNDPDCPDIYTTTQYCWFKPPIEQVTNIDNILIDVNPNKEEK